MPRRLRQPPISYTSPKVATVLDHDDLLNIGTNDHATIDLHIADTDIHVGVGTSTNNTLRWTGSAWVETAGVTIDPSGRVILLDSGEQKFSTQSDGVEFRGRNGGPNSTVDFNNTANNHDTRYVQRDSAGGFMFELTSGSDLDIYQTDSGGSAGNQWLHLGKDLEIGLFHDGTEMARTAVIGNGGFEVNNTVTGAGFERVLTTADLGGGGASALDDLTDVTLTTEATGDVLYKSAGDWVDTSAISINPAGQVDILNNTVLRMRTNTLGIEVHGNLGNTPASGGAQNTEIGLYNNNDEEIGLIGYEDVVFGDDDTFQIKSFCQGGGYRITATATGGGEDTVLSYSEATGVSLFRDDFAVLRSDTRGISVFDASGSIPRITFRNSGDTIQGDLEFSATEMLMTNDNVGDDMRLRVTGGSGVVTGLLIEAEDATTLYFDNVAELATKSSGVTINNELEITGDLNHDGTNIGFFGTTPAAQAAAYTPTNVSTDRAYDADSTSVDELADVLGTLIADLQTYGLIQ